MGRQTWTCKREARMPQQTYSDTSNLSRGPDLRLRMLGDGLQLVFDVSYSIPYVPAWTARAAPAAQWISSVASNDAPALQVTFAVLDLHQPPLLMLLSS